MVSINEFSAIDIRIGKIIDVQDLNTRKPMYGFKVDLGSELGTRTIAAGVKESYSKEELLGKKVVVLVNLDPKNIAGFESQGMVLAAVDNNTVSLLQIDKDIKEGSRVR